ASQTPKEATGSHELDLDFDAETRELLFVRDRFDETFTYFDGSTERRSGFTLIFYAGASPLDRPAAEKTLVAALSEAAAEAGRAAGSGSGAGSGSVQDNPRGTEPGAGSGSAPNAGSGAAEPKPSGGGDKAAPSGAADQATPPGAGPGPLIAGVDDSAFAETGIDIGSSPQGIVLSIRDLRFVADSDQVLPSELWRLDALASALRAIPDRRLLVEGHSAATGKSAGELELSVRRAKAVAEALGARGIEASRIAYRGYGSTRPIASNDTEEGRARNRRVEVTVLDY
ncbi:MAG TPA: OmpA family protein, partial [Rectinemataceae bacterium]|nr:OmpA family protein [Rectinemataceae bacterium]